MPGVGSFVLRVGSLGHKLPTPYKSCNQDKQRIFGENDSQGREFREFEAINSIPLIFGKIRKNSIYYREYSRKNFLFLKLPISPTPEL